MGKTSANIRRERIPKAKRKHDQRYGSEKVTKYIGHREHSNLSGGKHVQVLEVQEIVRSEKL